MQIIYEQGSKSLGFNTGASITPIIPLMLGDSKLAQDFSHELFDNGLFAKAIVYPTVAQGKARIRIMNSAGHSKEQLDRALSIFEKVGKKSESNLIQIILKPCPAKPWQSGVLSNRGSLVTSFFYLGVLTF